MQIDEKIKQSIIDIKKAQELADKLGFPINVAFSGGKDSQVLDWLCNKSGIKYTKNYQCTTVDPKEVLQFNHKYYPDLIWHRPKKSMFDLIEKRGFLPLRHIRYCCSELKENVMPNTISLIGVRKAESGKRSKYTTWTSDCVKGKDKLVVRPMLEFTDREIWQIIKSEIGFYCSLYDMGLKRIGCIACPLTSYKNKLRELQIAPKFEYAYKKSIRKIMHNGYYNQFENEHEVWDWYLKGVSMNKYFADKKQYKLF